MRRKIVKGISMVISLILMLTLLLTGCGSDSTSGDKPSTSSTNPEAGQSGSDQEKVKIVFWHCYGDGEETPFNENVLPKFREKYPNIEVEAIRQESGQYNQSIVTAFGTGQAPDVARIECTNSIPYANQNGIISLDEMEGFAELKEQCLENPMSTNFFRGKYYGLPLNTNCKAAVMNMNVMGQLGFTEPPKTMEEFIEASKTNLSGQYTINVSGVGDWDMYPYFWLFGGVLTDENFTKASGYLDSPQSIAAMNKLVELHDDEVFTIRDIDGTPDAWDGIETEYAMFFEGPWYFSSKPQYKDYNITAATIPTYNGKSASVLGGENIAIFSASKNPNQAFEFIKFMLSEETQLEMLKVGQFPILKSIYSSDTVSNDPVWNVYMEQIKSAQARIPSPGNTTIVQYWGDAMNEIFIDKKDPAEALAKAAELIDGVLAGEAAPAE